MLLHFIVLRCSSRKTSQTALATHLRPSFAIAAADEARKRGAIQMKGWCLRFGFASSFRKDENEKGSGTPTDAHPACRAAGTAARSAGARTPIGVPPRFFPWDYSSPGCSSRPCFLGRGGAPILSRPPSGGRTERSLCGRYPPQKPVPVQRAPRGPVRSAGRLMPKAARVRLANPPAGAALAPCAGVPPARVLHERESRTLCN